MRLLLAEDDTNLRGVLERGLKEEGYVVDAVANGDEALDYLRAYEYAVCILDWRMPGTSGLDVITSARRRGTQCTTDKCCGNWLATRPQRAWTTTTKGAVCENGERCAFFWLRTIPT